MNVFDRFWGKLGHNGKSIAKAQDSIDASLQTIPEGHFLMGSKQGGDDEFPIHNVMIDSFRMMSTQVTQGQWVQIMGDRPWAGKRFVKEGDRYPAVFVSYYDVARFIRRLNQRGENRYRLPSEAEWEYAARASQSSDGSNKSWDWGDILQDLAWFYDNAFQSGEYYPHAVATKKANRWGLYDMLGNVGEWCSDWYARNYYKRSPLCDPQGPRYGNKKMVRGGDWSKTDYFLRPTCRMYFSPHVKDVFIGFRLVVSGTGDAQHV